MPRRRRWSRKSAAPDRLETQRNAAKSPRNEQELLIRHQNPRRASAMSTTYDKIDHVKGAQRSLNRIMG